MNMKTALPWLVAVIGIAAAAYFFNANKTNTAQVATLQQDVQELQTLRAENVALKTNLVPPDELARLRKDSDDALRLRNEVRQLREAKSTLTQQAQSAQTAAQQAQQQAAQAQAETEAVRQRAAVAAVLPPAGVAPAGTIPANPQEIVNACINNLRQLDGAKQQWALENRKTAEAVPGRQDLLHYLQGQQLPQCPGGGRYTIGAVNVEPTCSIPGHALPLQ